MIVREHRALGRHFEVVGFSQNIDGTVEAVKDDFDGAVGIAAEPRAFRERREGAAGGSFSVGSVAGGTIWGVKLAAVLGGTGGGESE